MPFHTKNESHARPEDSDGLTNPSESQHTLLLIYMSYSFNLLIIKDQNNEKSKKILTCALIRGLYQRITSHAWDKDLKVPRVHLVYRLHF